MRALSGCLGLAAFVAIAAPAFAQNPPAATLNIPGLADSVPRTFDVQRMNFDLWCQHNPRYTTERCLMRLPEDVRAFEEYRAAVERYEVRHLREQAEEQAVQQRLYREPQPSGPIPTLPQDQISGGSGFGR